MRESESDIGELQFPTLQAFRYKKVLPLLWEWYDNHTELQPFVLPSILAAAHIAEKADFDVHLHDRLVAALRGQKSKHVSHVPPRKFVSFAQ